jgi:peroxiredoxin
MKNIFGTSIFVVALLMSACIFDGKPDPEPVPDSDEIVMQGDRMPAFTVSDSGDGTFDSASLSGKRVCLFFFTVACPHCRASLPLVDETWRIIQGIEGVELLIINRGESLSKVAGHWEQDGLTAEFFLDPDQQTFLKFARKWVPRMYIIDANGVVETVFVGRPAERYSGPEAFADAIAGTGS